MDDSPVEDADETATPMRPARSLELVAAILLGVASLATAYAAYRGSIVSDGVLANYSEATSWQSAANDAYQDASKLEVKEQTLFLQWAQLDPEKSPETAEYIFRYMDPAQQELVLTWLNDESPDTPVSPFTVVDAPDGSRTPYYPEFEQLPSNLALVVGDQRLAESARLAEAAQKADDRGDVFELSTVFLAVTLFLAGVATLLKTRSIQVSVLALASVMLVVGGLVLVNAELS